MDRRKGFIYLILTFIIWGSLYVVSKYALGKVPAFTISFSRFVLAFIVMSILCRGKAIHIEKKDYLYIVLVGVIGYFIAAGAQLLGTKYTGASLSSLLNSLNPISMTIFAAIFLSEKLDWRKITGILLAIFGVYIILGVGAGEISIIGAALSIVSVVLWSFMSVFTRKITQKYDSMQVTRLATGVAALCYLPVSIYELITTKNVVIDSSCVASLLYMGIVCTGVAYLLWNRSLSILEASTCSAFYPIQPLVSTILGVLLLHEKVGYTFFIGALLIVAGVLLSLSSKPVNVDQS